jgi:hypothetical protein
MSISLMQHLRMSGWLSKSIIFVFASDDINSSTSQRQNQNQNHTPELFRRWVSGFHRRHSFNDHVSLSRDFSQFDYTAFTGLLRDAVVLDFLEPDRSSRCGAMECANDVAQLPVQLPTEWTDGYLLAIVGSNGLLPNMDIPSALFSMEPSLLHLEKALDRHEAENYATQESIMSLLFPKSRVQAHRYYWANLMLGMSKMLRGADGWHEVFLSHNVESFTLRPMSPSTSKSVMSPGSRHSSKGRGE